MQKKEMEETKDRLGEVEEKLKETRIKLADASNEKNNFEEDILTKESILQEIQNEIETIKVSYEVKSVEL